MSDEKQRAVISPSEFAARMQPIVDRCTRRVGLLALLDSEGRARNKGTVFFTRRDQRFFVGTARHVVREQSDQLPAEDWPFTRYRLRVMVFKRGADLRAVTVPVGFNLAEQDLVWEDAQLDVALFNAPADLVNSGLCEFSDAKADAAVARVVRDRWQDANTEESSLATFILGFPNITHHVDTSTRTERLGVIPMTGYITALDRDSYDGHGEKAPQMMVELDPGTATTPPPEPYGEVMKTWPELLLAPVADGERPPLGGFSGAPLFLAHQHGESIIAVMKEGTPQFGVRVLAVMSCWDDVTRMVDRSGPPRQ